MITIGTPNFNTYKFSFILSYRTIDTISSIPYTKPHSEKEGDKKKEEKRRSTNLLSILSFTKTLALTSLKAGKLCASLSICTR